MTIYRVMRIGSTFVLLYLCHRYHEQGCAYRAAALAYTALFSLVPLAIVAFNLLSFVPEFREVWVDLQDLILGNFVPASADVISTYLDECTRNVTGLSVMNLFFIRYFGFVIDV